MSKKECACESSLPLNRELAGEEEEGSGGSALIADFESREG